MPPLNRPTGGFTQDQNQDPGLVQGPIDPNTGLPLDPSDPRYNAALYQQNIAGDAAYIHAHEPSWVQDYLPLLIGAGVLGGGAGLGLFGADAGIAGGVGAGADAGIDTTMGLTPELAATLGTTVPISGGIVPAGVSGLVGGGSIGLDEAIDPVTGSLTGGSAAPAGLESAVTPTSGIGPLASGETGTAATDAATAAPAGIADGGESLLPSTPIGTGDMPPITGGTGQDLTGAAGSGGGILSDIGKYSKLFSGLGSAISGATNAATNTRLAQNDPYIQRGKLEDTQRNQDLRNLYVADRAFHPSHSPFDPVAPSMPSGDYAAGLHDVSGQSLSALAKPPSYDVTSFPSLQPGTLAKIGEWAGPLLKILGTVGSLA